ncbi:hypothetical protein, partial [Burkholderia contaminans]|uniref:hypothetical protein n=1 Tax=Burkholderia contaminans TaxID=488447 RepID=UPI001C2E4F95
MQRPARESYDYSAAAGMPCWLTRRLRHPSSRITWPAAFMPLPHPCPHATANAAFMSAMRRRSRAIIIRFTT